MIEAYLRPQLQPLFNLIGTYISKKVSASFITFLGLCTGSIAAFFIAYNKTGLALFFLCISGMSDVIDGTVARLTKTSHLLGTFFDLISDRLVESALIAGFAFRQPDCMWAYLIFHSALLFHFSTFFMASTFLKNSGEKNIHYEASIIERAEAFIVFFLMIIFPQHLFSLLMTLNFFIIFDACKRFSHVTYVYSRACLLLLFLIPGDIMSNNELKPSQSSQLAQATFAGGCFWCMQPPFEKLNGVVSVVSGYTGGTGSNPVYKDYAQKGHIEAIQVTYDPAKISYEMLLDTFWHQINPTDKDGQFVDRGPQYRSAIFYHNSEQQRAAQLSKESLEKSHQFDKPIATEIKAVQTFYPAEEYHQDYYKKNPLRYKFYRYNSGRDAFLEKAWKINKLSSEKKFIKPNDEELRKTLTPLQYEVTQKNKTEKPFDNAYWNNEKPGIYVDIVSGEPLFSSIDKYDSGTGWPSFKKPLEANNIVEKDDWSWFTKRKEIRSKQSDSHLGHVFNDGPAPTGLRYCMNSAALRFIPAEDLEKKGYHKYMHLFRN